MLPILLPLILLVLSLVVGFVIFPTSNRRRVEKAGGVWKREATISSTLDGLVQGAIRPGTTIRIVGGDCANLTPGACSVGQYPEAWKDCLRRWRNSGAKIVYVLVDPNQQAWDQLKLLQQEMGDGLDIHRIVSTGLAEADVQLARYYSTHHFTLFEKPEMAWVEGNHPRGSTKAYDCSFYNEAALAKLGDFPNLIKDFNAILGVASRQA